MNVDDAGKLRVGDTVEFDGLSSVVVTSGIPLQKSDRNLILLTIENPYDGVVDVTNEEVMGED